MVNGQWSMNYNLFRFNVTHHATTFACVLQSIRNLPMLALELLLHLLHRQGANPCTVVLNTLVLARGAAALHFHTISVLAGMQATIGRAAHARDSHFIHSFLIFLFVIMFLRPCGSRSALATLG
jgi:hypothetical protein